MTRMIRREHVLPGILAVALILGLAGSVCTVHVLQAAAPQLKVYFASDFKNPVYQRKTYTKVATSWKRPTSTPKQGRKAVVIAVIQRDGSASGPRLHLASGSDAWDAAALEAVKRASPFDPLPKEYKRPSVEVHFHFEFN